MGNFGIFSAMIRNTVRPLLLPLFHTGMNERSNSFNKAKKRNDYTGRILVRIPNKTEFKECILKYIYAFTESQKITNFT